MFPLCRTWPISERICSGFPAMPLPANRNETVRWKAPRTPRFTIYVSRKSCYLFRTMIVSYRDKRTARFASGRHVKEFSGFARQAELRLDRLESATSLADLAALPGNRLEALRGDRAGLFSIRINDQWRICFGWPEGSPGPIEVEIVDYH